MFMCLSLLACKKRQAVNDAIIKVRITDAIGPYNSLFLAIKSVDITIGEQVHELFPSAKPLVLDILRYRFGNSFLVATKSIPGKGNITAIKLNLEQGSGKNSLVLRGKKYPLSIATQAGLTAKIAVPISEGLNHNILIDFDVAQSIKEDAAGNFIFSPQIRSYPKTGRIVLTGTIAPDDAYATILAKPMLVGETASAIADETGKYYIAGLFPGDYQIKVSPNNPIYKDTTFEYTLSAARSLLIKLHKNK